MTSNIQIARAVIFDIRQAETNNPKFIESAEALYEVCLLAHAGTSRNFSHLTLVLVGVKGFEVLLDMQPLIELEPSFKRAFGKLKQMMRISNQNAIYSSIKTTELILGDILSDFKKKCMDPRTSQLEIAFISATEDKIIEREVDIFLLSADECPNLTQLAVVHLAPSEIFREQQNEQVWHKKLVWRMFDGEEDTKLFFKSWLTRKQKNWNLKIDGHDGQSKWAAKVDIEDIVFDLHGWPNRISANFHESDGLGLLQDGNENTLEIIKWIRSDGLPEWLIHGLPRRLTPAEDITNETIKANNYKQFCSLSFWLAKEELVAIARLKPYNQVTDYFVLKPGSDGSILLRNIVPHELILPSSVNPSVVADQDDMESLSTPKEVFYEEIRSAYLQLPSRPSLLPPDQSSIVNTVEFHAFKEIGVAGSKSKSALPKSRKANR